MTYEIDYYDTKEAVRTVLVTSDKPIDEVRLPFIVRDIVGRRFSKIRRVRIINVNPNHPEEK